MSQGPSPLLGYNTNVRHKGKLYHIQTEDSGVNHPHIMTHIFADGGRIIDSKKTSYAEHMGADDLKTIVKRMMQEQHKALFIALRDGVYDEKENLGQDSSAPAVSAIKEHNRLENIERNRDSEKTRPEHKPLIDQTLIHTYEHAASRLPSILRSRSQLYQSLQTSSNKHPLQKTQQLEIRQNTIGDQSLNEAILNYLVSNTKNEEAI